MIKNNFYPLRSVVGPSVPVRHIVPLSGSQNNFKIITLPAPGSSTQTIQDKVDLNIPGIGNIYSKFLPVIAKDNVKYLPVDGMAAMPVPGNANNPLTSLLPGLNFLNSPSDIPFDPNDPVASIFGYKVKGFHSLDINLLADNDIQSGDTFLSNTDKDYNFLITLQEEALIGGICFSGYPYITSRLETGTGGMTLGNFGLPREIRLTPYPSSAKSNNTDKDFFGFQRSQFIDSEFAYSRQEIISHSGLNYLCIDPVKTDKFILTLTDIPFIIKTIDLDSSSIESNGNIKLKVEGEKGFAIPYLYFFEYKETTRKFARLHSGILGVKQTPGESKEKPELKHAFPEYEYFLEDEKNKTGFYSLYTAHSSFGQRRNFPAAFMNYPPVIRRMVGKSVDEMFVSDIMLPGEKVTIFLQQGEEFDRCVAGMKILFPMLPEDTDTARFAETLIAYIGANVTMDGSLNEQERKAAEELLTYILKIPPPVNFCEKVRIRIFDIDPVEGLSPAAVDLDNKSDPSNKYSTLLADTVVDDFLDIVFHFFLKGISFKKTSHCRYFAIELTNIGEKEGQVVIHSMELVRSAHVSVQPRAAKSQTVKAMHYRIIGAELADDFSKLGNEGFNFSIDRVVAGQVKNVLYSAMSLLDLLHTGNARIQSNVRRRAVEFERSYQNDSINQSYGDGSENIDIRKNQVSDFGWRRSETESNQLSSNPQVQGDPLWQGQMPNWNGQQNPFQPSSRGANLAFSSLGNKEIRNHNENLYPSAPNNPYRNIRDYINVLQGISSFGGGGSLFPPLTTLGQGTWTGRAWAGSNVPVVTGTKSVTVNPLIPLLDLIQFISSLNSGLPLPAVLPLLSAILFGPFPIILSGGGNSSISVQPGGVGASLGVNPVPSINFSTVYGSSGIISKLASEDIYSYNQYLNKGFNDSRIVSVGDENNQNRIIFRKEVAEFENERVRGAEVMWQGKIQDIITGSIPLNFTLPAGATKMNFRTADDTLRVRFNSGFSPSIEVDFWFEINEEVIKDDY